MELATTTKYWTGEREAILSKFVDMRVPYPDIAVRMNTTVGAVCGKVSRLGIGKGQGLGATICPPPKAAARAPIELPLDSQHFAILAQQALEADRRDAFVTLEQLQEHHCRFVIGDPQHMRHCGARRIRGSSYCAHHRERCVAEPRDVTPAGRETMRQHGLRRAIAMNKTLPRFFGVHNEHRFSVDSRSFEIISGNDRQDRAARA